VLAWEVEDSHERAGNDAIFHDTTSLIEGFESEVTILFGDLVGAHFKGWCISNANNVLIGNGEVETTDTGDEFRVRPVGTFEIALGDIQFHFKIEDLALALVILFFVLVALAAFEFEICFPVGSQKLPSYSLFANGGKGPG
jgi:hypothetical protein